MFTSGFTHDSICYFGTTFTPTIPQKPRTISCRLSCGDPICAKAWSGSEHSPTVGRIVTPAQPVSNSSSAVQMSARMSCAAVEKQRTFRHASLQEAQGLDASDVVPLQQSFGRIEPVPRQNELQDVG